MDIRQLNALAEELRDEIITTVSKNGGHLASNLGIVELTIALHYVFNAPKDKLIFDVGHQAYVHKLLTGRQAIFDTLRQADGISGFPKSSESAFDSFTAGHASTAISAALGLARARDLAGEDSDVIAIVGDGALSGGMCYEALNDAGQSNTRLIVVLNDNKMSISRNVGAMSRYLTHLRQSRPYTTIKRGVRSGLERIPVIGSPVFRFFERLKNSLKTILIDGKFFSALGFEYIGPIDGHDIKRLISTLSKLRHTEKPVLLHVVTQKGKGYKPAEAQPDIYHGTAPFYIESGLPRNTASKSVGCGSVVGQALVEFAREDRRICAVTAAMESGTGMEAFHQAFPDRFFDVGIAEEHAVVMAAGLASGGMRPYVAIYSTFMQRAFDQLLIDVCRNRLPVVFLLDRAGLVGADGETHQGVYDLSYLRMMPNMALAAPRDICTLKRLLKLSLSATCPLAIRYPRSLPEETIAPDAGAFPMELSIGKWEVLCPGRDITLIAEGRMVDVALSVGKMLEKEQISCSIVDACFVKPLDLDVLRERSAATKNVAVIEENVLEGGLGEAIGTALLEMGLKRPIACFAVPDRFIEQGSVHEQAQACGLDAESIAEKLLRSLRSGKGS